MSVAFFGLWPLRGIGLGTLICALLNGVVISAFSKLFTSKFDFTPLWNCPAWNEIRKGTAEAVPFVYFQFDSSFCERIMLR